MTQIKKSPQRKRKTGKKKIGRPTDYRPEYGKIVENALIQRDMTMEQIAKLFGVTKDTLYKWMKRHPEFADSIKSARDNAHAMQVERSLVEMCTGFEYEEVKTEEVEVKMGRGRSVDAVQVPGIKTSRTLKRQLPNVSAIKYFLNNRCPERWKEPKAIEYVGATPEEETPSDEAVAKLSKKELKGLRQTLREAAERETSPDKLRVVRGGRSA